MSDSEWKVGTWRTLLLGRGSRCRKLRFSVMNELLASLRREEVGDTAYGLLCLCCGSVLFQTCGFFSGVSPTHQHTPGYVKAACCHCSCPGWNCMQEVSLKESISCGCSRNLSVSGTWKAPPC